jgi:hypothetical protein
LVKITYFSYQEIVIHEIRELAPQQLFEGVVGQLQAQGQTGIVPTVLWLDGIAFSVGNFIQNDDLIRDQSVANCITLS